MALTVEQLGRTNVTGNRLTVALKITFDDSYPTGGEALDLTTYVNNIETVMVETSGGFVFGYDRTNKKLKAFEAGADGDALDEVDNATDLSTTVTFISVTGGSWKSEVSWNISCGGVSYAQGRAPFAANASIPSCTPCVLAMADSAGDGWSGNYFNGFGMRETMSGSSG